MRETIDALMEGLKEGLKQFALGFVGLLLVLVVACICIDLYCTVIVPVSPWEREAQVWLSKLEHDKCTRPPTYDKAQISALEEAVKAGDDDARFVLGCFLYRNHNTQKGRALIYEAYHNGHEGAEKCISSFERERLFECRMNRMLPNMDDYIELKPPAKLPR